MADEMQQTISNKVLYIYQNDWVYLFVNNEFMDAGHELEDMPRTLADLQPFEYKEIRSDVTQRIINKLGLATNLDAMDIQESLPDNLWEALWKTAR